MMILNWSLAIASLIVLIIGCVTTTYRHVGDGLFHPIVLANGLFAYYTVVPGAFILVTGTFTDRYADPWSALANGLLVLVGAYLAILGVYYGTSWLLERDDRTTARKRIFRRYCRLLNEALDYRVLTWFGYAGITIGLLTYVYYIMINGGPVRLVTVTPRTTFQRLPNTARWRWLSLVGLFGGTAVTLVGRRARAEAGRLSRHDRLGLVLSIAATFLAVVSFRARQLIVVLGLLVLVYAYTTGRFSDRQIVAAGGSVVLIGVLFTFVEFVFTDTTSASVLVRGLIQDARLDVFMGIVAHVPSDYPYQFGSTVLGSLPFEGAGLPLPYGQQLKRLFGVTRPGMTYSGMLPGELYLNFGTVGVLVGAAIYGAFLRGVWVLRDLGENPLLRGVYPVALTIVVLVWPTNVLWATKALVLRLGVPVVVAIAATIFWKRIQRRVTTAAPSQE